MFRSSLRIAARAGRPRPAARFSTVSQSARAGVKAAPRIAALAGALAATAVLYVSVQHTRLDSAVGPGKKSDGKPRVIPYAEVQRHNTPGDCWVVLDGKVYDLTKFAEMHPGGTGPIYAAAGRDATALFEPIHSDGIIEDRLEPSAFVGIVDPATLPPKPVVKPRKKKPATTTDEDDDDEDRFIPLDEIIGLPDLEAAARLSMSPKAWAYISAGATDMASVDLNRRAWNWILFRPRTLVDVENVDMSTTMLGHKTSVPFFICPTGMSKLAGPEGEPGIAGAAGECDVIQMVSTNSSAPLDAIVAGRSTPDQVQFMQLYVDRKRANSEALLRRVHDLGMKAVFVTVDCASPGKREADERVRAEVAVQSGISGGVVQRDKRGGGVGRTTGAYIDPKLKWDDLKWLRSQTHLPIGVKGIQCVEDAVRAADMGVDAIYLSNHGGRALDTSAPALYTLLELRRTRPDVFDRCEVYLDGGVRRGTDVVKALCLGARGVGIGRPVLYGLTYGKEGVVHAIDILQDEINTTLMLLGVTKLSELGPHLLNTKALDSQIIDKLDYGPNEPRV